ncbi:hypothetical protein FOMPIDRAFT_1053322 [Fomitopsis schrenkii]|uniref:Uncharacterized protein n=1 Tax=Fomitopsis schrenkii TaxID=2126942 RepID=S8FD07_FOMSC|nr:hypothetical protein FOMPIDRAFT_1053322 [Fomitopsis schrenkii]
MNSDTDPDFDIDFDSGLLKSDVDFQYGTSMQRSLDFLQPGIQGAMRGIETMVKLLRLRTNRGWNMDQGKPYAWTRSYKPVPYRAPFMGASALGTAGLLPRYVQQYSSTLP